MIKTLDQTLKVATLVCPDVYLIDVVGAVGPKVIGDPEVIAFIKEKATHASAIIGICGGVLLLGAAGLLEGRRATTNFHIGKSLKDVGAISVLGGEQEVVNISLKTARTAYHKNRTGADF